VPAAKWQINQNPEPDQALVYFFRDLLKTVKVKEFILISTIDVYGAKDHDGLSNEDTVPKPDNPYGLHRYMFEQEVRELFPEAFIIRLPGLYGKGLKKNCIYDFVKNNRTSYILTNSAFQWYDMSYLAQDIENVLESNVKLINLFPEPLDTSIIMDTAKKVGFKFEEPSDKVKRGAAYHICSKHGENAYLYGKETVEKRLHRYLAQERITASLAVSTIGWDFQNTKETTKVMNFLKNKGILNIEIAPTSLWGSWDGVKEALESGKVRDFAEDLDRKGFSITSMQAILYQLPEIQLFRNDDLFENHFKLLIDLCEAISVKGQEIKIVLGAPKNRNAPMEMTQEESFLFAAKKLHKVANLALDKPATICIEANPPAYGCEFLNTLDTAKEFTERYQHPKLKFMIDTGCAVLGNDDLSKVDSSFVQNLAHVHFSQPFLGPFTADQNYLEILKVIKSAVLENKTWTIETRNTGKVEDLLNTVDVVQATLEQFLVSV
jgi:sugar phosphate isomerase/epimerase